MDISARILVPVIIFSFCSGVRASQLYLQPSIKDVGYFTNDSFFTTCFTTDESMDKLLWKGPQGNVISETKGRVYVEQATEEGKGLKLLIESVQKEDEGEYVCSDDEASISFQVYVYRSISFGDTPSEQYVKEGENPIIKCNPKGQDPKISWHFNNTILKNGEKYKLDNNSLTVYDIKREDAGVYTCSVYLITSLKTQFKEMNINVTVQFKPEIAAEQKSEAYGQLNTEGNLSCSAVAEPIPEFEWQRDGNVLENDTEYIIYNTENTSILKIKEVDETHIGKYVCIARNSLGEKNVTIDLKEGDTPTPPVLTVLKEENGDIYLKINAQNENDDEDLKVTGYKVQYTTTEEWLSPMVQEFSLGDQHVLRNISYSTVYKLRVAARNAAGYGDYSEEIAYKTHDSQDVHTTTSSAVINLSFTTLILIAILL